MFPNYAGMMEFGIHTCLRNTVLQVRVLLSAPNKLTILQKYDILEKQATRGTMRRNIEHKKVYQAWSDMKYKCNNEKAKTYAKFGGSGISYDPAWESYEVFEEDMLEGYLQAMSTGLTSRQIVLGRIDETKDFSKENCSWMSVSDLSNLQNPRRNFIVAEDAEGERHLFTSCASMGIFYDIPRTSISNAIRRKTYHVRTLIFALIDKETFIEASKNNDFLYDLPIEIPERAYMA